GTPVRFIGQDIGGLVDLSCSQSRIVIEIHGSNISELDKMLTPYSAQYPVAEPNRLFVQRAYTRHSPRDITSCNGVMITQNTDRCYKYIWDRPIDLLRLLYHSHFRCQWRHQPLDNHFPFPSLPHRMEHRMPRLWRTFLLAAL